MQEHVPYSRFKAILLANLDGVIRACDGFRVAAEAT